MRLSMMGNNISRYYLGKLAQVFILYGLQTLKHLWAAAISSLFSFSWAASAEINNE
jgi:hypothetical protein